MFALFCGFSGKTLNKWTTRSGSDSGSGGEAASGGPDRTESGRELTIQNVRARG
jgi:hypothetical protein